MNRYKIRLSIFYLTLLAFYVEGKSISKDQNLREALQGRWYCQEISSSTNKTTDSTVSNTFLRFTFAKNNLYIALAPFDKGFKFHVQTKVNSFRITTQDKSGFEYYVDSLSSRMLILSEINSSGEKLTYWFTRSDIKQHNETNPHLIEHYQIEIILYQHYLNRSIQKLTKGYKYLISNKQKGEIPFTYKAPQAHNFASHFLTLFNEKITGEIDNTKNTVSAELTVSSKGLIDLKILSGTYYLINAHVYEILNKTGKKWALLNKDEESVKFRLSFLITVSQPSSFIRVPINN